MDIKERYWRLFETKRLTHQRYGELRFMRGLKDQVDTILEVLREAGAPAIIGNLGQFIKTDPLVLAYQDVYGRVGGDFAHDSFTDLTGKSQKAQSDWIEFMRNFATNEAGSRIANVTDVTLKRVRNSLERGISEGLGTEEIARLIDGSDAVNRIRARVIARTEIISASNAGADLGARSTGLNLNKEWLTSIDGREREAHALANGQKVAMDEVFIVDGEQCKYPGDPSLSAANVIQCRCVHLFDPI